MFSSDEGCEYNTQSERYYDVNMMGEYFLEGMGGGIWFMLFNSQC